MKFEINNLKIKTRKCKKKDYDFVFGIVKKTLFPFISKWYKPNKEMFDEKFKSDYKQRVILLNKKEKIGFFQLTPKEEILNITGIFILPKYQKKKIGTFLMNYFEKGDYKKISLEVWENNPVYKFYKKLGYKIIKKKKHKYHMEKIITRFI